VEPRRDLFQVEKTARLFIKVLLGYREQKKYLLHEFVVMPDHFHLILTPTGITLERSMQFVKGGFSFELNKSLKAKRDVWQPSFFDRRVRDSLEYAEFKRLHLAESGQVAAGADGGGVSIQLGASFFSRQPGSGTSAAKAGFFISLTAGLKACSTPSVP